MHVKTEQYAFTHGKAPRGRGNWWFSVKVEGQFVSEHLLRFEDTLFSDACRMTLRKAKSLKTTVHSISVCP